jgi:hypothetical protein
VGSAVVSPPSLSFLRFAYVLYVCEDVSQFPEEGKGGEIVWLYKGGDEKKASSDKRPLRLADEGRGDSFPPPPGIDGEAIDPAFATVGRCDDDTHEFVGAYSVKRTKKEIRHANNFVNQTFWCVASMRAEGETSLLPEMVHVRYVMSSKGSDEK